MNKIVWAARVAVVAGVALMACSSSSSGGGNSFPFSGPSCMGGPPGTTGTSASCTSCVQSACSSQFACVSTDCKDYYNCRCACQPSDSACASGCTQSPACMTCQSGAGMCLLSSTAGSCSNQCGSGSSSGGGSSGGSSSGSATGSCANVQTCCATLPSTSQSSCNGIANGGNQQACQAFLSILQDSGICH